MLKISIITASYNAAATITDCLQSITNQNYPVAEHIIIDGASTDSTLELINHQRLTTNQTSLFTFQQPTKTIIQSNPDNGIYDAMNKGITLATGDIIGILNADDFYDSANVLSIVSKVFEDPEVMSCYGDLVYVKETKQKLLGTEDITFKVTRYWKSGTYTTRSWYWGWMPPHPTFFVRKSIYDKFGLFRLDLGSAADYELMLRLLLKEGITSSYIPDVLVRMRFGGASNRFFSARIMANLMDRKAWRVNGLKPYPWTLLMKPLMKISQYTKKAAR